jgi:hypothetical protein
MRNAANEMVFGRGKEAHVRWRGEKFLVLLGASVMMMMNKPR